MTLLLALACTDYEIIDDAEVLTPEPEQLEAAIRVHPELLDLGLGQLGEELSGVITVESVGEADLVLYDLFAAEGPFEVQWTGDPVLSPGSSGEAIVSFRPQAFEATEGSIQIESDAPGDEVVLVPVVADTYRPALSLSPGEHDFGTLLLGESEAVVLSLENSGEAPAQVAMEYLPSSEELSITGLLDGTLDPGQSLAMTVTYTPSDTSPDEATLLVTSDDPGAPELSAWQQGGGEDPVIDYEIEIELSADDAWEGWLNGSDLSGGLVTGWSSASVYSQTLQSGTHVLAIHATDQASVIAGFIASVRVDGVPTWLSGDGSWVHTASSPSGSWTDIAYDDSSWGAALLCSDTSPWGSSPATLRADGADWIWHDSNCRALGESWYRLEFTLP